MIAIPVAVYYNIIVAWAIHYFFQSAKGLLLGDELPWETCRDGELFKTQNNHNWNDPNIEWQLDNRCCNLHNLHSCFNSTNSITAPEAFFQ